MDGLLYSLCIYNMYSTCVCAHVCGVQLNMCTALYLHFASRFRTLLTGPTSLLYLCLKQAQLDPHVVASVAKLLTTLVPLERITDVLCAKSGEVLFGICPLVCLNYLRPHLHVSGYPCKRILLKTFTQTIYTKMLKT